MSNQPVERQAVIGTGQAYLLLTATVFLWSVGVVIARSP